MVAVGRRKDKLDALVGRHGQDAVNAIEFDITKLSDIPSFVEGIINAHQDVDCVALNSGIQRKCDFSDPASIDIDTINLEFVTNYLSYLALTKAFLPFLQAKDGESALIYISSGLALVPIPRVANYCATKAALHQWILCLREQLKSSKIKVVEIYPPAVQTELHDEKHQPDVKNGRAMGMPLDEFTNVVSCPMLTAPFSSYADQMLTALILQAYEGLAQGEEQIPVGFAVNPFNSFETKRQELFAQMVKATSG